jgi:hypothetical protein
MTSLWNLDDPMYYRLLHSFEIPKAFTYAYMREGFTDKDKRKYIRQIASESFPTPPQGVRWWAFRISVSKYGRRAYDIENVPKLIIDAFCSKQIEKDGANDEFGSVALYPDDTVDHVRLMQVFGQRTTNTDRTKVEIFGYVGPAGEVA